MNDHHIASTPEYKPSMEMVNVIFGRDSSAKGFAYVLCLPKGLRTFCVWPRQVPDEVFVGVLRLSSRKCFLKVTCNEQLPRAVSVIHR